MKRIAAGLLVAAIPVTGMAEVSFFGNAADFAFFNSQHGYTLDIGSETFEENTMGASEEWPCDDPLVQGVANGPFPTGLDHNLTIQANTLGGSASQESPRGSAGLLAVALGAGYGEVSDILVANSSADSLDIILPASGICSSIGFDAITLYDDPVQIQVYDKSNVLIGQANMEAGPGGDFVGLGVEPTAGVAIGRVNIFAPNADWEGADNIGAYVPEPGTLSLLALGALALLRRR